MKTIHLGKEPLSVGELLAMARKKPVVLVSREGVSFVLEEADEFDREVTELGNSGRFMRFLQKRSREQAMSSIDQFAEELTEEFQKKTVRPTRAAGKPRHTSSARKKRSSPRG